jgi:hypothetical protein
MNMKRGIISWRLEAALEKSRRNDPDGPLASYAWMWRALVRSSTSPLAVALRFASLVSVDAALLLGWSLARPIRGFLRSPLRRVAGALGVTAAAIALMLGSPPNGPTPPWSGVPALALEANGLIRFENQVVADADALEIIRHYDVREASIFVHPEAAAKRVFEITNLLVDAGIVFTKVEVGGAP